MPKYSMYYGRKYVNSGKKQPEMPVWLQVVIAILFIIGVLAL